VQCLLERMETAPENVAIVKPGAAAITFRADIEIAEMRGAAEFLIPLATLDSVKDRLARDVTESRPGRDAAWHAHLQTELPRTNVRLRAVIETRRVSTADLMRWRIGTHLPLSRRHDEPIDLVCGELPVLQARIAEKDGRIALHVEQRRLTEDWPVPV
jgi:flagellar motor switch protein FliM